MRLLDEHPLPHQSAPALQQPAITNTYQPAQYAAMD
jgi:hypothetical protein